LVGLARLEDVEEIAAVKAMVERHVEWTQSSYAQRLLDRWTEVVPKLVRVMPHDYRRVLDAQATMRAKGLSTDEAEMAAFEQNTRDEARVGGN